ncbi:MAG: Gfo/Idh/MocA family oxidoreductase [Paenibacillaceae bacterium]|nr:Gfo/Idh/MocA family oxidoreductase [Paenibacillaceae bacterium]
MTRLTCAIVGAGAISRGLHIKALKRLTDCRLKWVCDTNAKAAERYAREFQVPEWTANFDQVLNDPEVDWIDIATPNHTHEELAIRALKAGKHVMCQKPMAPDAAGAARMVAAAEQANRQLAMYMCFRTDPAFELLHGMLQQGSFGSVISYRGKMISGNGNKLRDGQWRMDGGSGALDLLGVHLIDLFPWLHGRELVVVQAYSGTLRAPMKGDDVTSALYEFDDGVTAVMETTYCSYTNDRTPLYTFEINGTEGFASYGMDTGLLTLQLKHDYESAGVRCSAGVPVTHPFDTYRVATRVHQDFCDALLAGRKFAIDGMEGLKAVRVIEATRQAARERRAVTIPG